MADELANPVEEVVDPVVDPAVVEDAVNPAPFLDVDERTKFKTAEDAKKAFHEAGTTIARLSGWEKELKEFGVSDPRVAKALLAELRDRRTKESEAKKTADAAPKTDPGAGLSEEDKKVLAYLEKLAPQLGYAKKDDLKAIQELQEKLAQFEQSDSQSQEERRASLIEDAETRVSSWLKDAGVEDPNGKKLIIIGNQLRSWIENDQSRMERFYRGGSTMEKLLKEGYDEFFPELGWKATGTNSAAAAAAKGKQVLTNKTTPANGTASKKGEPPQKRIGGAQNLIDGAGDEAYEMFKKLGG